MSKITEYTSVNAFDSGDVLLKDGTNGTKIIPVESAASEFLRLGGQTAKNAEIEAALTNFGSNLAGLEAEYVATNDYAVGDFFMVENKLYKATEPISDGDTIVPDTNCVETDISTEFKATKEIVDGLSEEIVKKANVDGYYTNLSAGTADQLMASQKVNDSDPYIFRTSGGTSDIGNREELEIVGGSVAWNQLVQNGDFADGTDNWSVHPNDGGTLTVENGVATFTMGRTSGSKALLQNFPKIPEDHVFLYGCDVKSVTDNEKAYAYIYFNSTKSTAANLNTRSVIANVTIGFDDAWDRKLFVRKNADPDAQYLLIGTASGTVNSQITLQIKNVCFFDLTAMLGSEIADYIYELEQAEEGAGVAWFRKYFPKDYYDYNPGELMHVSDLQSHDTVGFNLWDEEWEVGRIGDSGLPSASSNTIRSKNFCRCVAGATHHMTCGKTDGGSNNRYYLGIFWYDADKKYISKTYYNNGNVIAPDNAVYFKITTNPSVVIYGNTYNHDICINLSWSGTRDGEYEPYAKRSYLLDPSLTLRGIPKLTGDGDLTYDGDVYKPDGTVERRYGIVDLGTLTWMVQTAETGVFRTTEISTLTPGVYTSQIANIICDKFITSSSASPMPNNAIAMASNGSLIVKDSTYANVSAGDFKTAMSGVYLVYELAEPTTEEAEPYTSPQIVDDWGTEEFVTTSIVPVGHNTSYPANLRDKLQHLPDLPDNDGYYMTQVTGAQMSLIRFRIPQAPAEDGTYVLKATVTDGVPVYTWVDPDAVPETEEPVEP